MFLTFILTSGRKKKINFAHSPWLDMGVWGTIPLQAEYVDEYDRRVNI